MLRGPGCRTVGSPPGRALLPTLAGSSRTAHFSARNVPRAPSTHTGGPASLLPPSRRSLAPGLPLHPAQPSSALGSCQGQHIPPPGVKGRGDIKPASKACGWGGPCLAQVASACRSRGMPQVPQGSQGPPTHGQGSAWNPTTGSGPSSQGVPPQTSEEGSTLTNSIGHQNWHHTRNTLLPSGGPSF